jgi:hypothetical protein
MVEIKTGATHKIGLVRSNYLDLAGQCYANAANLIDYRKSIGFMDAFEFTLEAGSEAKKEMLRKKEQIDLERKEAIRSWEQWKDGLNYFEQYDVQPERDRIEILSVGKRLDACWEIAKRYALFND